MAHRNRVKEIRLVKAGDLRPSPWNWRQHPLAQREALQSMLDEVGHAGVSLARELPDGGLELIDGHLRASLDPEEMIPVAILDVNEEEAKKILATYDGIGEMAEANDEALKALFAEIEAETAGVRKYIADREGQLAKENTERGMTDRAPDGPPEMELRPHEHYDYVIVLASTTHDWNRLVELLDLVPVQSARMQKRKVGVGRAITAPRLIALLEAKEQAKGIKDGKSKGRNPK
jgi:hypothetical protein